MERFHSGQSIGAYRIIRFLGEGGMGCVYEAEHVGLKVRRALKVFTTKSEYGDFLRKRFIAEGRILADLLHPRLVRVYDFAVDESSGAMYFAMDLVLSPTGEPQTLESACRRGVDENQVAGWFRDICEGLGYIHSKGIIHRDISLDNILIDETGHAVLSDFGIAKITGEDYRRKLEVTMTMPFAAGERFSWGKGLYMSPEMTSGGEATPESDAYAVGVLVFRLLAGSWYTPDARLNDALAGMEYNWAEVLSRLCSRIPAERLGNGGMAATAVLLRKSVIAAPRRNRWLLPVVGVLLLGLIAVGWMLMRGRYEKVSRDTTAPAAPASKGTSTEIFHIVDVTNVVKQTVYQIVPITNSVTPTQL